MLYNGNFSDEITETVIQLSEFNLENQEEKLNVKKWGFYLMAECFQNIIRHGEKAENDQPLTKEQVFYEHLF